MKEKDPWQYKREREEVTLRILLAVDVLHRPRVVFLDDRSSIYIGSFSGGGN